MGGEASGTGKKKQQKTKNYDLKGNSLPFLLFHISSGFLETTGKLKIEVRFRARACSLLKSMFLVSTRRSLVEKKVLPSSILQRELSEGAFVLD